MCHWEKWRRKQVEIALDTQELEWLHQSAEYIRETMKVAKTGRIHNLKF